MAIWNYQGRANVISVDQAVQYARQAGFTGQGLINAVAIAMSESGLNANSINDTTSGIGLDRGIVKFNSVFHSDVPDSCAFNPLCAFQQMYRVSNGGTNFCEWCTFNLGCAKNCNSNGPYRSNLPTVMAAVARNTGKGAPTPVTPGATPPPASGNVILDTVKVWGEYIAIFLLALGLIVIGFMLLGGQQLAKQVMP